MLARTMVVQLKWVLGTGYRAIEGNERTDAKNGGSRFNRENSDASAGTRFSFLRKTWRLTKRIITESSRGIREPRSTKKAFQA